MNSELVKFFSIQRQIFGVCPCCQEIFRLSDCNVYLKKKPTRDWMDKLEAAELRIEKLENTISETKEQVREEARKKGRRSAARSARKVDKIFKPNNYNADDAKVLFHPVDFLIFNGMKARDEIQNLVLFDRKVKGKDAKALQRSIENSVNRERYEWITMHVDENGEVEYR